MSEEFKIEIVNPEKSFLVKEDVSEVVVPAFEGEMGILKDHISIISFLKPGIVKILSKSGDENYYVEDGIVEFKNNNLSILTSSIFNLSDLDKGAVNKIKTECMRAKSFGLVSYNNCLMTLKVKAEDGSLWDKNKSDSITCEVNIRPKNKGSMLFHKKFGFIEAGTQKTDGGKKEVSLMRYLIP